MPKRATHDVAHAAYTDHRIASRPAVIRDEAAESGSTELRPWREADPQFRKRNLGLAYIYAGQRELSAEWIQKGFALLASVKSGDPEVEEALGSVLLQKQRPAEAATLFRQALTADASNPDYLHNLGVALSAGKDLNGAAAHLEHAVRTNPRFTASWLLLARIYREMNRTDLYERTLTRYLGVFPQNISARIALRRLQLPQPRK